jgi:hypothetical protein
MRGTPGRGFLVENPLHSGYGRGQLSSFIVAQVVRLVNKTRLPGRGAHQDARLLFNKIKRHIDEIKQRL